MATAAWLAIEWQNGERIGVAAYLLKKLQERVLDVRIHGVFSRQISLMPTCLAQYIIRNIDQLTDILPPPKDLLEIHRVPDMDESNRTYTYYHKHVHGTSRSIPGEISRSIGIVASSGWERLPGML